MVSVGMQGLAPCSCERCRTGGESRLSTSVHSSLLFRPIVAQERFTEELLRRRSFFWSPFEHTLDELHE